MPKPTKLHSKGKVQPNSIQKPCNDDVDPEETRRQFQLELCWCIQQLERTLSEKKGNEKQLQETWKVLTVLKNNNQPMVRKRQLMRTHFGDYRAKMAAEEKKLAKLASKIKISEVQDKPKATFLRKSAFLSTGDSSFRFNFDLAPEQVDANKNTNPSNTVETNVENDDIAVVNDDNTKINVSDVNTDKNNVEITKKFKFSFSDSEFKFNFGTNNL
ncbi:hypothetical protein O3G_MSEX012568 [Manduca sexta]|uniref:Uncharacterized protein n=1 Tax=Manduca sexta TaxID=7130 RepID=A0A921ZQ08_MANSE|nr:hypothetical protein O3G_MSEX012568 [Manduca sexta]